MEPGGEEGEEDADGGVAACDCGSKEKEATTTVTTSLGPEFWRAKTANLLSATFRGNVVVVKRIGKRNAGVDLKNRENLKELNSVRVREIEKKTFDKRTLRTLSAIIIIGICTTSSEEH